MDRRDYLLTLVSVFVSALIYLSIFLLLVKTVDILCYEQLRAAMNKK